MNIVDQQKYIIFLNDISEDKPNNFRDESIECPFCDRKKLVDIIDEKGPFVLLKNKYPTLKDTLQLVIIETYTCDIHMGEYSAEYMAGLIRFAVKHWLKIEASGDYKSVIFYKNHGPRSGGSIKHAHMQIVGLKDIDYKEKLKDQYFEGIEIYKSHDCLVNLSDKPLNGFSEFNIIIEDNLRALNELAYNLKKVVHYLLNNYFVKCDSFNIFFYHWKGRIICKVTPRFVSSPLLLGYEIRQVSSGAQEIADKLRDMYFR